MLVTFSGGIIISQGAWLKLVESVRQHVRHLSFVSVSLSLSLCVSLASESSETLEKHFSSFALRSQIFILSLTLLS